MAAVATISLLVLVVVVVLAWKDIRRVSFTSQTGASLRRISDAASSRLYVRLAVLDDKDFFVTMASDPTAAEANGWNGNEASSVRARFASRKLFRQVRGNELVGVDRATGHRVATATFSYSTMLGPIALSVGIHVQPDHRNKGYGRDMMAAAILLAQEGPVQHVVVGTRVTNLGLQAIMEHLGYSRDPRTFDFKAPNGKTYNSYWYACDAPPRL